MQQGNQAGRLAGQLAGRRVGGPRVAYPMCVTRWEGKSTNFPMTSPDWIKERGRRLMINSLRFQGIPENLPWVERIMRRDGEG